MQPNKRLRPTAGRFVYQPRVNRNVRRTNWGLFEKSKDEDRDMYNAEVAPGPDLALEARTPLGFHVLVTRDRWRLITTAKHPVMVGREDAVRVALEQPEQVRESRSDPDVLLFYRLERPGRWICAVAKRAAAHGFLITAYPTDAIKEGTQIWPK